jgi:phosphoenolpyruvate synthase/pyruvate phosphate dikinase
VAGEKLAELLKTQKSLTEWLEDIKHQDVIALRKEDNEKRERLRTLSETIGLPFDKPTQFKASELDRKNKKFLAFLEQHGDELCALRLIPTEDGVPKLRMRGKTITDAYAWFLEQHVDPTKYRADFVPHPPDDIWGTIFIVNKHGIQGEIIPGGHHQLTQGFHDSVQPRIFRYDFKNWAISPKDDDALAYLKRTVELIKVPSKEKQQELGDKLGATFTHDYIEGYFETTHSSLGTWYIDYSKTLGDLYADMAINPEMPKTNAKITGRVGCSGVASGPVCIVNPNNMNIHFPEGAVLVCEVTTPNYVPFMQQAVAIVTDQGGILSHAAIVARELKKPCIVGAGNATQQLTDGQIVTVDANIGTVT